jgi:hypothetical protein
MNTPTLRCLQAALVLGSLIGLPRTSSAQFQTPPNSAMLYTTPQTQGSARALTAPAAPMFSYTPFPTWGWGSPFPYGFIESPVGGYLRGTADVITATGNYQISRQQARQMNEQNRQAQLETRRQIFDQMRYEQAMQPTLEDLREKDRQQQLRRSRSDPPLSEITSAIALNQLFANIQRVRTATAMRGPFVPIAPDVIRRINLTDGTIRGSSSFFKNGADFSWPLVLERDEFAPQRKEIETVIPEAVNELRQYGRVQPAMQNKLIKTVDTLRGKIGDMVTDLTPDEFIRAMRHANQLRDGIRMFDNPNAANFFNGKWEVNANDVGTMVDQMTNQGLKFAPAAVGSEAAYQSLYRSLLNYDTALAQITGS